MENFGHTQHIQPYPRRPSVAGQEGKLKKSLPTLHLIPALLPVFEHF